MAIRDMTVESQNFQSHDPRFDVENQPREPAVLPPRTVKIKGKEFKIPAGAKLTEVPVHIGDKALEPVTVQIGPTPGYVFAVFSHNPTYHNASLADWHGVARNAIERWCAQEGKRLVQARVEFMAPYNFMGEYQ